MLHNSLRYILAVAQAGSIRVAANMLNVAQSAISRQIINVEADLGVSLFERHARGVSLTPAGEVFLRFARDTRGLSERVRSEIDALSGFRRGVVRIWAIDSVSQDVLPRAIIHFTAENPGIRFEVTVASTEEVVAAVEDVRADIGIAFQPQLPAAVRASLRLRFPVHALMSVDHPLAKADSLSLTEALEYPIALTPAGSGSRILLEATALAAGVGLMPKFESNSIQMLSNFAQSTSGITFLSRLCAASGLKSGQLAAVRLRDRLMSVARIEMLLLRDRALPAAAAQFHEHMARALRYASKQ
ncbi:LysR family transcriptional regulator [Hyphomicrobium sp. CS1BSMeth3]|uniref:LysR family transcriptional regulator n=1 Tax=Hyphomicrobium sp. CS1BSMeth3 TaxID=1892844 RepID=UPI0009310A3C|nr:LysR family transcriptional regulator [Hyphomicrobium sp. CS1BSMeth3]MBN9268348.1 LysR family transcriptional regulator [Hyphomicrobium sp.]